MSNAQALRAQRAKRRDALSNPGAPANLYGLHKKRPYKLAARCEAVPGLARRAGSAPEHHAKRDGLSSKAAKVSTMEVRIILAPY